MKRVYSWYQIKPKPIKATPKSIAQSRRLASRKVIARRTAMEARRERVEARKARNAEVLSRFHRGERLSRIAKDMGVTRQRIDQIIYRDKANARGAVYDAVRSGVLVRPSMCACGTPRVEAHHPDYSKPLDVVWLCKGCHAAEHSSARRSAAL